MAGMQALAAAITAAIQAATAAAAPPPNFAADLQTAVTNAIAAAQQQVLPPGAFSLHPATVSANPIDYSTSTGAKLYRSATEQLQNDALYSLDDPYNNLLIENLATRATSSRWQPILQIAPDVHLLESYGAILQTDITTHVRTILANANRAKQSDAQLLKCL
jgi:hypothetical protein